MAIQPLDVRVRELWKAVAVSSSERHRSDIAILHADNITAAFINRFYPTDSIGKSLKEDIKQAHDRISTDIGV